MNSKRLQGITGLIAVIDLGDCTGYAREMELVLLRHAPAESELTVPSGLPDDRPLTTSGRKKMARAARGIARLIGNAQLLLSSPLSRCSETALILKAHLDPEPRFEIEPLLAPGKVVANFSRVRKRISEYERVVLCGHEPDLSLLVAMLTGAPEPFTSFKKGGLAVLELNARDALLKLLVTPKLLRTAVK